MDIRLQETSHLLGYGSNKLTACIILENWYLYWSLSQFNPATFLDNYTPVPPEGGGYTVLPLSVLPSVCPSVCLSFRPSQDIFRHIFLSNYWWQKSDIWSQASYRYPISWEAFLDPSDSYFLFADLVGFYTHWTYMRGYHKWALVHSSSC